MKKRKNGKISSNEAREKENTQKAGQNFRIGYERIDFFFSLIEKNMYDGVILKLIITDADRWIFDKNEYIATGLVEIISFYFSIPSLPNWNGLMDFERIEKNAARDT